MVVPDKFFDVEFNKAMAFGYKTEDVDEFVTKAIDIIKALQEENQELMEKMGVLASTLEKYREDEESLRSALIGAQKLGDSILKDSRSKAEVILRDATTKADHIVEEANARLRQETAEYERIRAEVTSFRENLINLYKVHIDQIKRMPHNDPPVQKQAAPAPAPAPEPIPEPAPPPPVKVREAPLPVLQVEEPEPEEETPPPALELPVKKAPGKKPALRLELEDVEDDSDLEDEVILSKFSGKMSRLIARQEPEDEDFEDDDEEEEELQASGRTIFSTKFGEMRFGESFSLTGDDKGGAGGGRSGRGRR